MHKTRHEKTTDDEAFLVGSSPPRRAVEEPDLKKRKRLASRPCAPEIRRDEPTAAASVRTPGIYTPFHRLTSRVLVDTTAADIRRRTQDESNANLTLLYSAIQNSIRPTVFHATISPPPHPTTTCFHALPRPCLSRTTPDPHSRSCSRSCPEFCIKFELDTGTEGIDDTSTTPVAMTMPATWRLRHSRWKRTAHWLRRWRSEGVGRDLVHPRDRHGVPAQHRQVQGRRAPRARRRINDTSGQVRQLCGERSGSGRQGAGSRCREPGRFDRAPRYFPLPHRASQPQRKLAALHSTFVRAHPSDVDCPRPFFLRHLPLFRDSRASQPRRQLAALPLRVPAITLTANFPSSFAHPSVGVSLLATLRLLTTALDSALTTGSEHAQVTGGCGHLPRAACRAPFPDDGAHERARSGAEQRPCGAQDPRAGDSAGGCPPAEWSGKGGSPVWRTFCALRI
ncbi:hypothetical protein DFH09DRAFT_1358024 [Mycena vulgaris]|nr:hypothetical protein DFH09DRAFT_1358024 [Mycena vulgaris]